MTRLIIAKVEARVLIGALTHIHLPPRPSVLQNLPNKLVSQPFQAPNLLLPVQIPKHSIKHNLI